MESELKLGCEKTIRRIVDNVYLLCEVQGKNIGYVEKSLGLRLGYFSRKKRVDSPDIPLSIMLGLTQIFDVSVEYLMSPQLKKELALKKIQELKEEIRKIEEKYG